MEVELDERTLSNCINLILELVGMVKSDNVLRSLNYQATNILVNPIVFNELMSELLKVKIAMEKQDE